jgi:hypothetical protein
MPSPTPAIDLINRSFRLAKILASGETPTAEEANDALAMLNDILENWSVEPLALWGEANDVVTTVGGQATYTIGPTGNFNVSRPMAISGAYVTFSGVDFPLEIVGQLQYNEVSLKTQQQPIPEQLLYVNDFPLGRITLWPVPTQAMPLTLTADRLLTQIPNTATVINYPPGAAKALRELLAIELATEYGVPVDPQLRETAMKSKADYKRSNRQQYRSSTDPGLLNEAGYVNWRTGT